MKVGLDMRPAADPRGVGRYVRSLAEALHATAANGHELVETDPEVLRVVREAVGMDGDAADATRQCLRVGARAVLAAHVSVETHIVEKRFDAMTDRFD